VRQQHRPVYRVHLDRHRMPPRFGRSRQAPSAVQALGTSAAGRAGRAIEFRFPHWRKQRARHCLAPKGIVHGPASAIRGQRAAGQASLRP
jgi:hypothetical protein